MDVKYVIHRDIPLGRWNVFALVNGREEFVCAFERLSDAQAWVLIQSAHFNDKGHARYLDVSDSVELKP